MDGAFNRNKYITTKETVMRLYEFANAQEQLALWKLISDSVWDSISVQAQAQEQKRAKDAKAAKKAPKSSPIKLSAKRVSPPTPPKPRTPPKKIDSKTDSKTDAEAKQKSAQVASQQRQQAQATVKSTQTPITVQQQKQQVLPKAFTDTAQSNAATRPLPSSTAASLAAQNAVRARSIAQTQRSLYPLAHDEVVKRLTS